MKRLIPILAIAAIAAAFWAPTAQAEFGLSAFDVTFTNQDGSTATQAGSHPFAMTTDVELNHSPTALYPEGQPDEEIKDFIPTQMAGLLADTTAYPQCQTIEFVTKIATENLCPAETAIGVTGIAITDPPGSPGSWIQVPVFNLVPPPGALARVGFVVVNTFVTVDVGLGTEPPYRPVATVPNVPQLAPLFASVFQLWGNPSDPAHDELRGWCAGAQTTFPSLTLEEFEFENFTGGSCSVPPRGALLTVPTRCTGQNLTSYAIASWLDPGTFLPDGEPDLSDPSWVTGGVETHDAEGNPQPFTGCEQLGFEPSTKSQPSTENAETGSGFDFSVDFTDQGIKSPTGLAQSQAKKSVVTLPEGVTINPSVGEGLAICTPADLERETLASPPGAGCPNGSKLGTLQVSSPLLDETVGGSVFLAQQDDPGTATPGAENPFDSLIALYLVVKDPGLGVLVKLPLKVEPDPRTGQLVATLDDVPQVPVGHFNFHFKEGARAPLITPAACGTYTTKAVFYPWAAQAEPTTTISTFEITRGIGGGPCPPGGIAPFKPDFGAGSLNNNAGSFSPFNMRLIREDGEQDMTKFSSILPPGVLGSLRGVDKCPDAAIELAKSKTGLQELASPSCPANSLIGHTEAGAGVGSALTYASGQIYLGGPYKGAPLSVISITPAVAGPFDAGTVVVRLGLDLNPKTAEVEVDGAASDPIPHILKGIVLKVRDLRVYVDRPNFTLNPTSCDESSAKARLFGSFLDVFSSADDVPVDLATRYQAANCLNLGFKPKLNLNLKGGTKRGGHPGLSAVYVPRPGDANIEGLVVRLPRSAFLDQAHIRTICTRVQFAADACPKAAQYGYIRAWTPLLDEPLQGPVWLRSSNHKLPDLVFDLHGLVDVEVSTRIDSAKGGIRASLEDSPDAPLTKVVLRMQGGKKGLIINSRNLCGSKSRANVQSAGHNGKQSKANPVMRPQCAGKHKTKRHRPH